MQTQTNDHSAYCKWRRNKHYHYHAWPRPGNKALLLALLTSYTHARNPKKNTNNANACGCKQAGCIGTCAERGHGTFTYNAHAHSAHSTQEVITNHANIRMRMQQSTLDSHNDCHARTNLKRPRQTNANINQYGQYGRVSRGARGLRLHEMRRHQPFHVHR